MEVVTFELGLGGFMEVVTFELGLGGLDNCYWQSFLSL